MKAARRSVKPVSSTPKRPAAPPRRPRTPRTAAPPTFQNERQRRWFEAEVEAFSRLVHTARLTGDFVTAQRLERELSSFVEETRLLLGAGETCEAIYRDDNTVYTASTKSADSQTT